MLEICVKTVKHSEQRYETCGDWWFDGKGALQVRVSSLGWWVFEFFIAIHEMIEAFLCKKRGIKQKEVDTFDEKFERLRGPDNYDEPGDNPRAPYQNEHCLATGVERILVSAFGVKWKEYEEEINRLCASTSSPNTATE